MEYTIRQLGQLAGVSGRTLRWYDELGLLRPAGKTPAGYRLYGPAQLKRLQQILFYREFGLPLMEIRRLLDEPGFDAAAAMQSHLEALQKERELLNARIANAQKTLREMKGETQMSDEERFEGFKKERLEENERLYGEEIRQKYGEEQVAASNRKWKNMKKEDFEAMQQAEAELRQVLEEAAGQENPPPELAQKAFELHRRWLGHAWASYSPEAHLGLADLYEVDERFADYYNQMAPGAAAFLCAAIRRHAKGGSPA